METAAHTYRVNEIFYSLQGEGLHVGMPAVFVRFSGCNLCCPFCDTNFAAFSEMTTEDIVARVQDLSPSTQTLVILTGGEPMLQVDQPLLDALHRTGKTLCLETNGTLPVPESVDFVTCSPKEGSRVVLTKADELKVVFCGQDVERWAQTVASSHRYLQPLSCSNTEATVAYILHHPHWALSLQTHKLINIR